MVPRRSLGALVERSPIIFVGQLVSYRDDLNSPTLVENYVGTNSDPNYKGALERNKLQFERRLLVKVLQVLKGQGQLSGPQVQRGKAPGERYLTLSKPVYEHLAEGKGSLQARLKRQVKAHQERVAREGQGLKSSPMIYLADTIAVSAGDKPLAYLRWVHEVERSRQKEVVKLLQE